MTSEVEPLSSGGLAELAVLIFLVGFCVGLWWGTWQARRRRRARQRERQRDLGTGPPP